jgi:hypothetical protein
MIPKIVCLCGSTRFANAFMEIQFQETVNGNVVLTVGCFPRKQDGTWDRMKVTDEQKEKLDLLHLHKIKMADEVFIINVGGYIGESTLNELDFAKALGKPIRFLEPEKTLTVPAIRNSNVFMVHKNSGNHVFVKTLEFFKEQGGFHSGWGNSWVPIIGIDLNDARKKAEILLKGVSAP